MTQAPPAIFKIPTESPQPARGKPGRASGRAKAGRPASGRVVVNGTGRAATRGGGEVIELGYGVTVYPARGEHCRWRAVWYENGERQQCEAGTEQKLAARLEKVTERLAADAPNMKRPGAALIAHYLDPDRLGRATAFRRQGHGRRRAAGSAIPHRTWIHPGRVPHDRAGRGRTRARRWPRVWTGIRRVCDHPGVGDVQPRAGCDGVALVPFAWIGLAIWM